MQESVGKGALTRKGSLREDKESDVEVRRKSVSKLAAEGKSDFHLCSSDWVCCVGFVLNVFMARDPSEQTYAQGLLSPE